MSAVCSALLIVASVCLISASAFFLVSADVSIKGELPFEELGFVAGFVAGFLTWTFKMDCPQCQLSAPRAVRYACL